MTTVIKETIHIQTKLEATAEALAYVFNRGAVEALSADTFLWTVAETLLAAYPEKVQKALLVLMVHKQGMLSGVARDQLVSYLTDEVNVWGE